MGITRRRTLKAAGALAASTALGCDSQVELAWATDARELLSAIDHVVVLTMENRSFDHMLGSLRLVEGRTDVDGLTGEESNVDLGAQAFRVYPLVRAIQNDPLHVHDKVVYTWNHGKNDGFVQVHHAAGYHPREEVMGYHTRKDLPILYALADEYTVCDAWFASMMGPTWPNRLFLHCATSNGNLSNETAPGLPSLFDRLDAASVSSRYYYGNLPLTAMYGRTKNVFDVTRFFEDCDNGTLPAVAMIDPAITTGVDEGYDDHPPLDFGPGQAFVAAVYDALANSRHWAKSLLILIYDEHGGFFDHVAPPTVVDEDPRFRRLGFRVPALLIGPSIRKRFVLSDTLEHVSVHATINRRFDLEPLNGRAARANDIARAIDPQLLRASRDPITLPRIDVTESPTPRVPGPGVGQEELRALFDREGYPRHFDLRPRQGEIREYWMRRCVAAGLARRRVVQRTGVS